MDPPPASHLRHSTSSGPDASGIRIGISPREANLNGHFGARFFSSFVRVFDVSEKGGGKGIALPSLRPFAFAPGYHQASEISRRLRMVQLLSDGTG